MNHIFYADDLVLLFECFENASSTLIGLKKICEDFGLSVSTEKSFTVYFSKNTAKGIRDLQWGNCALPTLSTAKYLGCSIDRKIRFDSHMTNVRHKANRAFSVLMGFQKRYPQLSFSRFLKLYYTLVYPTYAYSAEVFAWAEGEKLNSIFVEHLRRYFNLPTCTAKNAIHYFTGTYPIQLKIWKTSYKFWYKIASLDEHRLEKLVYRTLKNSNCSNWFSQMVSTFEKIGFEGDVLYWGADYIKLNMPTFFEKVHVFFSNQLCNWAHSSSYRFLTQNHKHDSPRLAFLDNSSFWDRRVFARILLKGYKMEETTGPWHKIEARERFCQHCINHAYRARIGDENHYLFDCPRFETSRSKVGLSAEDILHSIFADISDVPHATQYHALAKYIHTSFAWLIVSLYPFDPIPD